MLGIVQCFGKWYSCHPQGEHVLVGQYWLSYLGQGVCGALNVLELIGGAEELATVPRCLRKRSEKNL
jgi:hypothetical protein